MSIQVSRTGGTEYGRYIKALVCGDPGAGKTRFGRTWPNPYYVNANAGLMSIARDNLAFTTVTQVGQVEEILRALQQEAKVREQMLGVPVETVIIDTFDDIQRMLIAERLKTERKESMAQADWGWLGDQCRGLVRAFRNLDMHVIFTCHIKTVQDEDSGKTYVKPQLQGAFVDEIAGYVDLALLFTPRPVPMINEKNEATRRLAFIVQTYPDATHAWVKDRSGQLPMEFELTFEDDYKRIDDMVFGGIDGMNESVIVKEAEQVVQQAPAPVAAAPAPAPAPPVAPPAAPAPAPAPEVVPDPSPASETTAASTTEAPAPQAESAPAPSAPAAAEPTPAPAPEPAPAPPAEPAPAPVAEAPPAPKPEPKPLVCEVCTEPIDQDQADLSSIRFRKRMCRACMKTTKQQQAKG